MKRLNGKRVLITRAAEDCATWAAQLREAGAVPVILPCIECEPIDEPGVKAQLAEALPAADWLVFTSRRGVEALTRLIAETRLWDDSGDIALPDGLRIAVVGPATADAALTLLGRVDLVAESGTAASLAQALAYRLEDGPGEAGQVPRILIAVAENAASVLEDTLGPGITRRGGECTRINVYRTVAAAARTPRQALSELGADKILLASPTAVTGLLSQIELDTAAEIFTIGPATSQAARAAALTVTAEATNPSLEGLMEAMR